MLMVEKSELAPMPAIGPSPISEVSVGNGRMSVGNGRMSVGTGRVSVGTGNVSVGNGNVSVGNGNVSEGGSGKMLVGMAEEFSDARLRSQVQPPV